MKPLRTKAPAALDNPSRWHHYLKPWFDVEAYQSRIDQAVGVNKDRKSIIRLVWGQDVRSSAFGQDVPRYWTRRAKLNNEHHHTYWTVPRFMFEKRLEPEQYVDAWERTRWSMTDPQTRTPVDKGPAPEEYYTFAYLCAEHEVVDPSNGWAHCCTRQYYTNRARCWGTFRLPSDDDLDLIRQAVRQMEVDPYIDPYRPVTMAELQEAELAANMQVERANEQFAEYERQMIKDFNRLHGHRLFEGPDSFHDMGGSFNTQTPEGIYIPD